MPNEYPRASAILAGLGLTAQLAAAATDGIPIAKLVLGVVSRIVTLAEDIEKRRTALHALAQTARTMGESIEAVVAHRELGAEIERSLDGLHTVFRAIEALFAKHRAKRPFFRALSYAFTTLAHIEALGQELSRAAQQFAVVATLETHAHVQEANTRLQETNCRLEDAKADINVLRDRLEENSAYTKGFRNLHDCDVSKLEVIHEQTFSRSRYKIQYFTARVDGDKAGQLFVLRYFERKSDLDEVRTTKGDHRLIHSVSEHDKTLKKFSTVQNSHPNIARMYGWSLGNHLTRFTVMKSGYIPISKVAHPPASSERAWDMIVQVVDALCHLEERDASWHPDLSTSFFLDDSGRPTIGLNNDLRPGKTSYHLPEIYVLGKLLADVFGGYSHMDAIAARPVGVPAHESARRLRCTIPWSKIPTLNDRISGYLRKALRSYESCEDHSDVWIDTGPIVLYVAASGRKVGPETYSQYWALPVERDSFFVSHVEGTDDELIHVTTHIDIPVCIKPHVREKLGITVPEPAPIVMSFSSTRGPADPRGMGFRPHLL